MKKLRHLWKRIPRPLRACVDAAIALLLIAALYISISFPALTFEQAFRRMEKQQLLGPSRIVSRLNSSLGYMDFDDLIVGETDSGVIFCSRRHNDGFPSFSDYSYELYYREKTGDITVLAAPCWCGVTMIGDRLPVYVFDSYPDAVKAELKLTVTGSKTQNVGGEKTVYDYSETFYSQAQRDTEGHFCFYLELQRNYSNPEAFNAREAALGGLSRVCYSLSTGDPEPEITATVKLYDEAGELILEKTVNIESLPTAAHRQD